MYVSVRPPYYRTRSRSRSRSRSSTTVPVPYCTTIHSTVLLQPFAVRLYSMNSTTTTSSTMYYSYSCTGVLYWCTSTVLLYCTITVHTVPVAVLYYSIILLRVLYVPCTTQEDESKKSLRNQDSRAQMNNPHSWYTGITAARIIRIRGHDE